MLIYRLYQIKNKTSLQGKNICNQFMYDTIILKEKERDQNVKRACCFTSLRASMTLESSFVVPLFLIAMIGSMLFGELLIVKSKMHGSILEAVRVAAEQQYYAEKKGIPLTDSYIAALQKRYYEQKEQKGFLVLSDVSFLGSRLLNEEDEVEVHMTYHMTIQYPLFPKKDIRVEEKVYQKAFTGYKPNDFESGKGYVYVTKYGNVYHRSLQCSHIMLKVSESREILKYLQGKTSYRACEKCAGNCSQKEQQLYIPMEGDCYHTSLTCSGLTRLVQKVTIWEAERMRPCSRCAN